MKLPHSKDAVEMFKNEIEFVKYQKILDRKSEFCQKVD